MRKIYLKLVGVFNSSNNTFLAALMILVLTQYFIDNHIIYNNI